MKTSNILISSAGRRSYLVRWFVDAARREGLGRRIIVADASWRAPALQEGDEPLVVPAFAHQSYEPAIVQICQRYEIGLAISLNDHELTLWSGGMAKRMEGLGITALSLDPARQTMTADKYRGASSLAALGVTVPHTLLATEYAKAVGTWEPRREVVVKPRFGSGSAGVVRCQVAQLDGILSWLSTRDSGAKLTDELESDFLDNTVIQQAIPGTEFGIDVINDLSGTYAAVLAREKIRMRAGETDVARTTAPSQFASVARRLSAVLQHRGSIDADVIEDRNGGQWVIDINPRFGGGYPFCHLAGVDLPAIYLAWLRGASVPPKAFEYSYDVFGAKHDEIALGQDGLRHEGDI